MGALTNLGSILEPPDVWKLTKEKGFMAEPWRWQSLGECMSDRLLGASKASLKL